MNLYGARYGNTNKKVLIDEKVFVIDGYSVADRLLEGLMFYVSFNGLDVEAISIEEEDEDFFEQFNKEIFLGKVREQAESKLREACKNSVTVYLPAETLKKYNVEYGLLTIKDL